MPVPRSWLRRRRYTPNVPPRTDLSSSRPLRGRIERVSVVILAFDTPADLLERSVAAVLAAIEQDSSDFEVDVVVIDNGSAARERLGHLQVEVVETGHNLGFAGGMNVGIRRALERDADAVALLNDDVMVEMNWLPPLVDELLSQSDVGSAQPTLLHDRVTDRDAESSVSEVGAAEPVVNSAGVVIDRFGAGSDRLRDAPERDVQVDPIDIDAFTGGAVVLHRNFFENVGLFDERFFLYYEDVELSRRGRRAGWRHRHVPASRVWHAGSATTAQLGSDVRRLQERNRLWSSAMHGSAGEIFHGLWLSVRRLRHPPRHAHRQALVQGVVGLPTRLLSRIRHTRLARSRPAQIRPDQTRPG
jgi:N-acetylglucosaminyl-diphospho-decaprenol L-rhamnosyltransferase